MIANLGTEKYVNIKICIALLDPKYLKYFKEINYKNGKMKEIRFMSFNILLFNVLLMLLWSHNVVMAQVGLISTDINISYEGTTDEIEPFKSYDMSGYGTEFGCHEAACKGRFAYTEITGDFDVFCRIENVYSSVNHCAAAGLMARASTDQRSTFVKVVANSNNRVWSAYDPFVMGARYREGGHLPQDDSWLGGYWYCIPENMVNRDIAFPSCWLRLKREGNVFTGYFAQTATIPNESDWNLKKFTFALGNGPEGPSFVDHFDAFPEKMLVGICLEANVEGIAYNQSFASFREIHGLQNSSKTHIHPAKNNLLINTLYSFDNYVMIELKENSNIEIFDLKGTLLISGTLEKGMNQINPCLIGAGIYLVRCKAGNYCETEKLVLKR